MIATYTTEPGLSDAQNFTHQNHFNPTQEHKHHEVASCGLGNPRWTPFSEKSANSQNTFFHNYDIPMDNLQFNQLQTCISNPSSPISAQQQEICQNDPPSEVSNVMSSYICSEQKSAKHWGQLFCDLNNHLCYRPANGIDM